MSAADPIDNSKLPPEIQSLIRQVVKRARLWKRERHALTLDLLAHFHDGLDAGRSSAELLSTFGDPKIAAKLMRRGKKRNRPLWWKTIMCTIQCILIFIGLYVAAAVLLSLRQPNVATDYLAKLNEPLTKIPDSQKGLPLYFEAWQTPVFKDSAMDALFATNPEGDKSDNLIHPGQPDWPKAHALLAANAKVLQTLRDAAARPAMGYRPKTSRANYTATELAAFGMQPTPGVQTDTSPNATPLLAVLLPQLSRFRASADLLASDMLDAAANQDPDRVVADYRAILGMAAHAREQSILVSELVACGMANIADRRLAEIVSSSA